MEEQHAPRTGRGAYSLMAGTFTNILLHIVFSTKDRDPMIPESLEDELHAYLGGIIRGERGQLLCAGGMPDHVHLLVLVTPAISVAELLRRIKGNSSTWINRERKIAGHFRWQEGYGAFSVSESAKARVMEYIRSQKEHHRKRSFQDEFTGLLEKHGIEWDERYIWD